MKKIYVISGKDEFELAKNINDCDKEIFATQPMQKKDGEWIAFVYVEEEDKKTPYRKETNGEMTEKQRGFLEREGYEGDISKLNKKQASEIIKNIIKSKGGELV